MSRATLSLVALAGLTIGCGSGIKDIVVQPAPSTLQAVADSTTTLIASAATQTDAAMAKVRVATISRDLEDARTLVLTARDAAATANTQVDAAIRQGEWLRTVLVQDSLAAGRVDYERYWRLGRQKLTAARQLSSRAVAVADSALSCTEQTCAASRARQMASQIEAAAGVTREAESVVRVAMVHVH